MKKRPLDRTKVVWRHLPPSITQAFLTEQIDSVFSGRYDWVSFRPGKSSQKRHTFSRAYIKFRRLEDGTEFAEFFNGHVFVNEKGAHFKTIVEYAPFQRVPAQRLRKDSREGTLLTDPDYIEFLKLLVTPVENLPSAKIQLERREADGSGAAEGVSIVTTPLMDYVRRKRASKRSRRRGKLKEESGKSSAETRRSLVPQLNTEKRTSTTMCVLTDTARTSCSINKGVAGSDNCRNKKIQLSKRKVQQTHKVFRGIAPQLFQELHMTVPSAEKHDRRSEKHNLFNQDVHKRLPENRLGNEKGPPGASLARPYVRNANSASHVVVGNDLLRQRRRVRFN